MTKNIFVQYLIWQFIDVPRDILKAWKNFLWFTLNYFSVPTLIRTYVSHWHKYYEPYGRAIDFWRYFEAFVFNSFSRLMGVILRTVLIITGIFLEILVFFVGLIVFIGWLVLPFLLIIGLIFGIELIF